MKRISLFLIIVLITGRITSQTTFQKGIYLDTQKKGGVIYWDGEVKKTADKGIIILETSLKDTNYFKTDAVLMKIDSLGEVSWTKQYQGSVPQNSQSVDQTLDGGYIFSNQANQNNFAYPGIFLTKVDQFGNISWSKRYSDSTYNVETVRQTPDHGYILLISMLDDNLKLIKTDSLGNIVWCKAYQDFFPLILYPYCLANCLSLTSDEGFIISATEENSINRERSNIIMKLNGQGEVEWSKSYSDTTGRIIQINQIETTAEGGYIMSGAGLIKTNATGDILWSKSYKGVATSSIQPTKEGYIIGGTNYESGNSLTSKMCLLKTDSLGALKWSKMFSNYGTISYVSEISDNRYTLVGHYHNTIRADLTSLISTDNQGNGICNDPDPTTITSDLYLNSIDLSPTTKTWATKKENTSYTVINLSTKQVNCINVDIKETMDDSEIIIYPNPSSGEFNFSKLPAESTVEIYDVLGHNVFQSGKVNDNYTLNLDFRAKGLYFYKVLNKNTIIQAGKISLE